MTTETKESTALVPIAAQLPPSIIPSIDELSVMTAIAKQVVKATGMVPSNLKSPEQAFAVMLAGRELGAQPMTALRHIFVVNGKTEPDAQLMMGVAKAKDPTADFTFHKTTATECDAELFRKGKSVLRQRYTIEDVRKAGLAGKAGPWQQYPADMLRWFTLKRLCRLGAPDLINALDGVSVAQAGAMMDEVRITEVKIETPALDAPGLYNAGDDPTETPTAAIEAEVVDEAGITRDEFDAWWQEKKFKDIGHVARCLGIPDGGDDPLQAWVDSAEGVGLPAGLALECARDCGKSIMAEYKVSKSLSQARSVIDPKGRLQLAAEEYRAAHTVEETEEPPLDEPQAEVGSA